MPPTLNPVNPDDAATGLDLVALKMAITHVLSNEFGLGGGVGIGGLALCKRLKRCAKDPKKD
jgi:3-oxoacyl-(acyl-carrier-protein) synthase